jgi:NhaP-type Na+/H+ or K+/H+ antiporter
MRLDQTVLVVGATLLVVVLLSLVLRRLWLSAVLVAMLAGILIGPHGLGLLTGPDLGRHERWLEQAARFSLAFSVVAVALRFNRHSLRLSWRRTARLLGIGMPAMWGASALGAWLLLNVSPWQTVLIGAALAATDPVVASVLISGELALKAVPDEVRQPLELEAASNDSLAIVFVLLPLAILTHHNQPVGHWIVQVVKQLGIGITAGAAIGAATAWVANRIRASAGIETAAAGAVPLALTILALTAIHLLGGAEILGAWCAGLGFASVADRELREQLQRPQQAVEELALVLAFILFGVALPFAGWSSFGWAALGFALWILLLRRPPFIPVALAGTSADRRGTTFLAWFGPLGAASIYYAAYVLPYHIEHADRVFAAITLAVFASVIAHAITATPAMLRYADRNPTETLRRPHHHDPDLGL